MLRKAGDAPCQCSLALCQNLVGLLSTASCQIQAGVQSVTLKALALKSGRFTIGGFESQCPLGLLSLLVVGCLFVCLFGWLVGWLVVWLVGWLVGWLFGWLFACLLACLFALCFALLVCLFACLLVCLFDCWLLVLVPVLVRLLIVHVPVLVLDVFIVLNVLIVLLPRNPLLRPLLKVKTSYVPPLDHPHPQNQFQDCHGCGRIYVKGQRLTDPAQKVPPWSEAFSNNALLH